MKYLVNIPCRCGCGETISEVSKATYHRLQSGEPVGYLPGHAHKGVRNPRWNGGQSTSSGGYRLVWAPTHPNARKSGYILEHRMVTSEALGRPLRDDELVHHHNLIKTDNRRENLGIKHRADHTGHHVSGSGNGRWIGPEAKMKVCPTCRKTFTATLGNYRRNVHCSRACSIKTGEQAPNARFSDDQIAQIRAERPSMSLAQLAARHHISLTHLKRILRGECRQL